MHVRNPYLNYRLHLSAAMHIVCKIYRFLYTALPLNLVMKDTAWPDHRRWGAGHLLGQSTGRVALRRRGAALRQHCQEICPVGNQPSRQHGYHLSIALNPPLSSWSCILLIKTECIRVSALVCKWSSQGFVLLCRLKLHLALLRLGFIELRSWSVITPTLGHELETVWSRAPVENEVGRMIV